MFGSIRTVFIFALSITNNAEQHADTISGKMTKQKFINGMQESELAKMEGAKVEVSFQMYSHHSHYTTREGVVSKTDKGTPCVKPDSGSVSCIFASEIRELAIIE
jgi:hypothetical protein